VEGGSSIPVEVGICLLVATFTLHPMPAFLRIVRFEVLTAVKMTMFFWVVTPCELVVRYQGFGETYCLHPRFSEMLVSN
jgi:hypothetical protein